MKSLFHQERILGTLKRHEACEKTADVCRLRFRWLRNMLVSAVVTMILLRAGPICAQHASNGVELTTEERLQTEAWWPTKSTLPIDMFSGSGACTACHADEVPAHPSSMVRAATLAVESHFLSPRTRLSSHANPLIYYLTASASGDLTLSASGGPAAAQKLDWVIGDGVLGRTFLYHADGRWYQSEFTYYTTDHSLDVTTGLSRGRPHGNASIMGQVLTTDETRRCFGCHTVHATTAAGFNPLHAEAGLGCEACHGPGQAHVTAARAFVAQPSSLRASIFNPAKLLPADSIDFCGSCHRTFSDAVLALGGTTSPAAVRFQPYRLEESKCWRTTEDERLTCVACHNPHDALNRDSASYDGKCVSCHRTVTSASHAEHLATVCPKATGQCTTCHMPKVKVPSMHGDFTDHDIRIVRPGEAMPS